MPLKSVQGIHNTKSHALLPAFKDPDKDGLHLLSPSLLHLWTPWWMIGDRHDIEAISWPDSMQWQAIEGISSHMETVISFKHLTDVLNQLEKTAAALSVAEAINTLFQSRKKRCHRLQWRWQQQDFNLDLTTPQVMGIINNTPDSFSDGGAHFSTEQAVAHSHRLIEAGVDLLDLGGESTRPGAESVSVEAEMDRVIPVIKRLRAEGVTLPISIDSQKPQVILAALDAGASMVNDVSGLRGPDLKSSPSLEQQNLLKTLASYGVPIIMMHMAKTPEVMQQDPQYHHVLIDIYHFFQERLDLCAQYGILPKQIILDPGIGFGKTDQHNRLLIQGLGFFAGLGTSLLLGVSRKRIIGSLTGVASAPARDPGSHALGLLGLLQGAQFLRVHDVVGARQTIDVYRGMVDTYHDWII
ncbi:dihydropteroate synthase [Magnetococcales bacterium HHB-1]